MPSYQHAWVNHTQHIVDPLTGACTNHVEGFLKNVKKKNKDMCGTTAVVNVWVMETQRRQFFASLDKKLGGKDKTPEKVTNV